MRALKLCLCGIAAVAAIACIVMPVMGVRGVFSAFDEPYSAGLHFRMVAEQTLGPVYTLLVVVALAVFLLGGKRIPWVAWLLALLGPVYTSFASGMVAHDFSHVVFQECSGIYGQWIDGINVAAGVALGALARVSVKTQPMQRPEARPAGGIILRVAMPAGAVLLGLVAIASGWDTEVNTSMVGTPTMLYGAAFVAIGFASFGLPTMDGTRNPKRQRFARIRLWTGLALGAMFLIGAFVRWS